MKNLLRSVLVIAAVLAMAAPAGANPPNRRDPVQLVQGEPDRYTPHPPGIPVDLHYLFGPYVVPPGQDSNRITVDVPVETGFIVAVAPDLIDASSGRVPTQQEAHIHHAHWFRVTDDPSMDYYEDLGGGKGLSWVFGTGEEKTQGRMDDRARLEPQNLDSDPTNDFTYGIPIDGTTPNAMIYMIHNKLPNVGNYFVVLDVTFIPGTRDQILAATGHDIHPLYEQLWGQTKTVTDKSQDIGARWTVTHDGMAIAMGSHIHPGGKAVVVSNLGPMVTGPDGKSHPMCQGIDPDGDGHDGVAILNSYKYDHNMAAWPYTEDYQMGATKFGWRAPLHKGDILEQQADYALTPNANAGVFDTGSRDDLYHNWYEAMSYTGIYYDRLQDPGPAPTACTMDAFAPHLLGNDDYQTQGISSTWMTDGAVKPDLQASVDEIGQDFNMFLPANATPVQHAIQGMVNHIWQNNEPLCAAPNMPGLATMPSCGPSTIATTTLPGPPVTTIHAAGFTYSPGDLGGVNGTVVLPTVKQGSQLTLVNDDASLNVRHTFTSCAWPCVGTYVSNFPLPTGGPNSFDTGKIGNLDPIDGGLNFTPLLSGGQTDTVPEYTFTVNLPPGKYAYFCRIHPFMRGAFEVVA